MSSDRMTRPTLDLPVALPYYEIGEQSQGDGLRGLVGADIDECFPVDDLEEQPGLTDSGRVGCRCCDAWRSELQDLLGDVLEDYCEFYSPCGLLLMGGGIGTAAVFANSSIDAHFQSWNDERVFNHNTSRFAYAVRDFGDGAYMVPLFTLCALARPACDPGSVGWCVGEWGYRSLRSFLVGGPAVGVLQYVLGGARPENLSPNGSHWTPFHGDHGVSGHAFIGGITFLNAAMLTDCLPLKSALYVASVLPGWSRIIQDKHYLSQVVLGWWLAYLSASAVDMTDRSHQSSWIVAPVATEDGVGVGVLGTW